MERAFNALKALGETDDELIVGNHIVLFGGRDLTGIDPQTLTVKYTNPDGSHGDQFSKAVDLESDYTKTGRLYVDFEHGRDPDGVGVGKHNILGYVDWGTKSVTNEGVFVKRVLYRRNKYVKMLEPLIKAGLIGNSSEAVPELIQKSNSGEITQWGLARDTLTVMPMEPRMLDTNALAAVKALAGIMPQLKSYLPSNDTALTVEDGDKKQPTNTEKNIMETEEIKAITEKAIADALAKRDAEQKAEADKLAAEKAAEEKGYAKAIEDLKNRRAPAFNTKTVLGFSEEKDAVPGFKHWMATGQENEALIRPDSSFDAIQNGKAAWNVTTGGSGGFLVPDPLYNTIIAKRDLASWVRQAPVQTFQTAADHLLVPRESTKHTAFVATAEAAAYDENEASVTQKDLILYKYTKMEKVSEEFLMYQSTNFEQWLASALGRAEAVTENTLFTNGTGTGEPEGIAAGSTVTGIAIKTSAQLNPEDLTSIIGKLGAGYNVPSECGFLMANVSKWYLKNAILAGPFAFASNNGNQGAPDFFGYNAYVSDDMPAYTSTTNTDKVLLFGNFSYYGIVEKPGMIVQRNPYLYMINGQIGIFASIFRGGGVLQAEAIYHDVAK